MSTFFEPVQAGQRHELRERIARPDVPSEALLREVVVLALAVVDVEPRAQRDVEEVRLREPDEAQPALRADAKPEEHLLAPAEEVPLAHVERGEEAVEAAVARADAEDAGRPFPHVDVHDDLVGRGSLLGVDVHLLEIAEVEQPLAAPHELLEREQLALGHAQLPPQNLLRALRVAGDVDPLDVDRPALDDRDAHVDLQVRQVVRRPGLDLGSGPAQLGVAIHDRADGVAQRPPVEDTALLEGHQLAKLLDREDLVARDRDGARVELRPLHHAHAECDLLPREVGHDLGGLHARLDVAVVGVELEDTVHVVVEHLALHGREGEDPVQSLLRRHRVLDLARGERACSPR